MFSLGGIAVDAAKGALNLALQSAVSEFKLTWGFRDDLNKLRERLTMIQVLLDDAGVNQALSNLEQLWLAKVKMVARHVDDLFDEFALENLRRKLEINDRYDSEGRFKARYFFFLCLSNPLGFRWRIAHQVKEVMSLTDEVFLEAKNHGLRATELVHAGLTDGGRLSEASAMAVLQQQFEELAVAWKFIGRDQEKAYLVEVLCRSSYNVEDLQLIAIVGPGGIGKTELARQIYDNEAVIKSFTMRIWISVSDDFNIDKILNRIVQQLGARKPDVESTEALMVMLCRLVGGEKYLLVLDDVSNEKLELWDSLKTCLLTIFGSCGSMVLITTRSNAVAVLMEALSIRYLEGLSPGESWELFEQTIFVKEEKCPSSLESIGREIVDKCNGNPLAIKTLGATLRFKRNPHDWESIANSELWKTSVYEEGVQPYLLLSFQHLPSLHVKQCFSYCSVYQRGAIIKKKDLIFLWMAQGLLCPQEGSSSKMEEIGEIYFNVLLNHSFLQVEQFYEYGGIRTCKMHDLVHNLARIVSRRDLLICGAGEGGDLDEGTCISHLLIGSDLGNEVSKPWLIKSISTQLRTIQSFVEIPSDVLMQTRYIRVLRLSQVGLTKLPDVVGELKHLRYFDVSYNPIKELPESITTLYNLQTLNLDGCSDLHKLPMGLSKLVNLRHLLVSDFMEVPVPTRIDRLTSLQSIPGLRLTASDGATRLNELGCLPHVKNSLMVSDLEHVKTKEEAEKAGIDRKAGIVSLGLRWSSVERAQGSSISEEEVLDGLQPHPNLQRLQVYGFNGDSFPSWLRRMAVVSIESGHLIPLDNLTHVRFSDIRRCVHLPALGQLPLLKTLIIDEMKEMRKMGTEFYTDNDSNGVRPVSSSSALFPALQRLEIMNCPKLAAWLRPKAKNPSQVAFPCLEILRIIACPLLTITPADFPSLRHLELKGIMSALPLHNVIKNIGRKYCKQNTLTSLLLEDIEGLTNLPQGLCQQFPALKTLVIRGCFRLACLPDDLGKLISLRKLAVCGSALLTTFPEIWALRSLIQLVIASCPELRETPSGLNTCTSLETLFIAGCPKVDLKRRLEGENMRGSGELKDYWTGGWLERLSRLRHCGLGGSGLNQIDEDQLDHFVPDISPLLTMKSLRDLTLWGWPKIKFLPEQLGSFTTLEQLVIAYFDGIEDLPEWMSGLSSLCRLSIMDCSNLRQFPSRSSMQRLKQLKTLLIWRCPLLAKRCGKDDGPEWHKISHMKYIEIDDHIVQDLAKEFSFVVCWFAGCIYFYARTSAAWLPEPASLRGLWILQFVSM